MLPRNEKAPLWHDIRSFSKKKIFWVILLFIGGLLGLVVPVIPGLLMIALSVALLRPGMMAKIRKYFKQRIKRAGYEKK